MPSWAADRDQSALYPLNDPAEEEDGSWLSPRRIEGIWRRKKHHTLQHIGRPFTPEGNTTTKKGGNQNPTRLLDELVDRSSTSVASKGSESVRDEEEAPSRCILFTSIMSPTGNTGQVDKSLFAAILKPPELLRRIAMRWRTAGDKVQKFSRRTRHEETFTYTWI